jgi:hypothetical protein
VRIFLFLFVPERGEGMIVKVKIGCWHFTLTPMPRNGAKTNEMSFTRASCLMPYAYFHLNPHALAVHCQQLTANS